MAPHVGRGRLLRVRRAATLVVHARPKTRAASSRERSARWGENPFSEAEAKRGRAPRPVAPRFGRARLSRLRFARCSDAGRARTPEDLRELAGFGGRKGTERPPLRNAPTLSSCRRSRRCPRRWPVAVMTPPLATRPCAQGAGAQESVSSTGGFDPRERLVKRERRNQRQRDSRNEGGAWNRNERGGVEPERGGAEPERGGAEPARRGTGEARN